RTRLHQRPPGPRGRGGVGHVPDHRDLRDLQHVVDTPRPGRRVGVAMTVIQAQPPVALRPQRTVRGRRRGPFTPSWLTYAVLAIVFLISVFPFYWTIVAASTSNTEINQVPPNLVPGPNLFHNFDEALSNVNMGLALVNSTIVSGTVALGTVF